MVRTVMSDEYSLHSRQRYIVDIESGRQPFEADTAVYEYSAFFSSDECRISLTGAEKGVDSCHWAFLRSELSLLSISHNYLYIHIHGADIIRPCKYS